MAYGIVYKLTNKENQKNYVGQTTLTLEERLTYHKYGHLYVDSEIRKYGMENFSAEILAVCETKAELDAQEIRFIKELDCMVPNGYNWSEGGNHHPGSQNGDGWMIMYREALAKLAISAPSLAFRVFALLASKQVFENSGISSTKQAIADEMGMSYQRVWEAFKWLKENLYIKEIKVNGQTQFLLNPDVTTCGKNKKKKVDLWNSVQ